MSTIEIQLDAYVVPDDHAVYKFFPGKTYRFREVVRNSNVAFLDIRGLDALGPEPEKWDDGEVLDVIAADRFQRELSKSKKIVRFASAAVTPTDKRTLTFLKGLLLHAKRGDLIVVPADGYRKDILFGEIMDDPGNVVRVDAKDGDSGTFTYVGRTVKWRAFQEKRFLSQNLIDLLHTPSAFFRIGKREMREEVYRIAYENFVYGDIFAATFETTKEHFSTSDSAVTAMWFNVLSAVNKAIESNEDISKKTFLDLALTRSVDDQEGELAININSPGQYILRSLGVFALATMAMLPLTEISAAEIVNSTVKVELKTVGSAKNDCSLRIEQAIKDYAETLSVGRLRDACKIGQRARTEATLKTKARLKKGKEKPR